MNYNSYSYSGYNTYREIGVKTASQGKLVVMLYDGAVSHLCQAIGLVDDSNKILPGNIEEFTGHIQKAQDIITELQVSLNMAEGGEIAKNLMALYIYFNKELLGISISHDKNRLSFIRDTMKDLGDAWARVSETQANGSVKMNTATSSISITG